MTETPLSPYIRKPPPPPPKYLAKPESIDESADKALEEAAAADAAIIAEIANLPWTFNPPIHPSLLSHDPSIQYVYGSEVAQSYAATTDFSKMRLGRIFQGKQAMSFAAIEMNTRFGFRFHYNPPAVSGALIINGDFVVDPSVPQVAILQEGLESLQFELMLNRMPEVQGHAKISDYNPPMSQEDMDNIHYYGTHWDLEFLYRVCNGVHQTRSNAIRTGDIGILLPNPSYLQLGNLKTFGTLETIQADDILFDQWMVPMLTRVNLSWRRMALLKGASIADLKKTSATTPGSDKETPSGAPANAPEKGGPGGKQIKAPESGTGWKLAPCLKVLADEAQRKYPGVHQVHSYGQRGGSTGHVPFGASNAEAKYGTKGMVYSLDLMINVSQESYKLLNSLIGQQRLWYAIHDRKIWSHVRDWKEKPYSGESAHTDHIHISMNTDRSQKETVDSENDTSPWGL